MSGYVEVAVDLPLPGGLEVLDYAIPARLAGRLRPGIRVRVPVRNRAVQGWVVALREGPPARPLREVAAVLDPEPLIGPDELELARWIARRYLAPLGQVLALFMPPGQRVDPGQSARPREVLAYRLAVPPEEARAALDKLSRAPRQRQALALLLEHPDEPRTARELAEACGPSAARSLAAKGLIEAIPITVERNPYVAWREPMPPVELTAEQARAVAEAEARLGTGETILLHGVTGSGKTEVYLQLIERVLARGQQAILLVPEIALTPQAMRRFQGRFPGRVAMLHSGMSEGERYDHWWKIYRGEAPVVVGARSAIFAPTRRLGLVVVDEEHATSYKQEESPRYHAREVAMERARRAKALCVLGSATPSLESYYASTRGRILRLEMGQRVDGRRLPRVRLIDLRQELKEGHQGLFSRALERALVSRLEREEQAILLLNRRGYQSFLLCRICGAVVECPHCQVSLTYHKVGHRLRCHYCGTERPVPRTCPACGGAELSGMGVGTQQVEEALYRLLPGARVLRLDADTTARKGAHDRILRRFEAHQGDILVGTQMVAKGLDFPRVTLVGVIDADTSLRFPDFRGAELAFQLITQVAGRAGRGLLPGEVLVQTYLPEHYSLQAAREHDYGAFFQRELAYRRRLGYPPFTHLLRVLIQGRQAQAVEAEARGVAQALKARRAGERYRVLGPAPAPLAKLKDHWRWQVLLVGPLDDLLEAGHELRARRMGRGCQAVLDMDPVSLL
ncbi:MULTISPECIES: primosomal protein N' [Limnochorda]|uniref:replication restart helicase PriA n=1 Tax=Limnochorda TaxID=1676651 RepID=UPI001DF82EEE|nr:primosomal protein N' [Limnochorda pilosa]MBO2486873.1 primosomal protein N' [Bacillota bacterium]MBO2519447.1 primosomal protein N' [Bacillota bacterium]